MTLNDKFMSYEKENVSLFDVLSGIRTCLHFHLVKHVFSAPIPTLISEQTNEITKFDTEPQESQQGGVVKKMAWKSNQGP